MITVSDAERSALVSRFHSQLHSGLGRAESLIGTLEDHGDLIERIKAARRIVDDLSRGMHPKLLQDRGLAAAIIDLAGSSPLPTILDVDVLRRPMPVETAAYEEVHGFDAEHTRASHALPQLGVWPAATIMISDAAFPDRPKADFAIKASSGPKIGGKRKERRSRPRLVSRQQSSPRTSTWITTKGWSSSRGRGGTEG